MTSHELAQLSAYDAMWEAWDKYMAVEDTPGVSRAAIDKAREEYREKRAVCLALRQEKP